MNFLLEVIASSVDDAIEAEQGGAGRVELCVNLAAGGMTPPIEMVRQVARRVQIPVRVMVCENDSYSRPGAAELRRLCGTMRKMGDLGVEGVVIGFDLAGVLDVESLTAIVAAAPVLRVTFHRVFERLRDRVGAVGLLKTIPQVDRILLCDGDWDPLVRASAPEIRLIAGGGLKMEDFLRLLATTKVREFHTGRPVRGGQQSDGRVNARLVRNLIEQLTTSPFSHS